MLAALNHPNIASIYGVEESGGIRALVMELVEGETLADQIARGPVPLNEALAVARQIALALESAHEQGIIHRDLKPANIKLRDDGTVKVLDFGLAKLADPIGATSGSSSLSLSPTITSPALTTNAGMLLGTAAYMSPEQAKGRPADKRSDLWAFGCVFFEMLTGKRAFEAEDVSETLAAVLRGDPDWTALPAATPPAVRTLIRRCLEKDRRKRVADSAAVLSALDEHPNLIADTPVDRASLRRELDATVGAVEQRAAETPSVGSRQWCPCRGCGCGDVVGDAPAGAAGQALHRRVVCVSVQSGRPSFRDQPQRIAHRIHRWAEWTIATVRAAD